MVAWVCEICRLLCVLKLLVGLGLYQVYHRLKFVSECGCMWDGKLHVGLGDCIKCVRVGFQAKIDCIGIFGGCKLLYVRFCLNKEGVLIAKKWFLTEILERQGKIWRFGGYFLPLITLEGNFKDAKKAFDFITLFKRKNRKLPFYHITLVIFFRFWNWQFRYFYLYKFIYLYFQF